MTEKLQSVLQAERLSFLLDKFNEQGVTDSILGDLTDSDLKELGVEKLGERKRLLAAFGKSGGSAVTVSVVDESAAQTSGSASSKNAATPAEATKDSPWVNTLGMPFVPIPRFDTRFCIWPVRVQDYEAYCMASGAKFPEIPFSQEPDHPMVGVSWNDSIEFCVWLTGKERSEGKIDENIVYRLPTDLEWSASVGLPHEPESTPAERHLKAPGYPWGLRWPPPQNAGNYEHRREDQLELVVRAEYSEEIVRDNSSESHFSDVGEYCRSHSEVADQIRKNLARWQAEWVPIDEYKFTSPVGTFAENPFGVQDSGGNVWEWCMDDIVHKDERAKVARGASFSLCPLNGISVEREVVFGTVVYRQTSSREWGLLTIKNADAYKSSYRHYGNGEKPLSSSEFGTLVPGQWGNVPCGGFRAVLVAC